MATVNSSLRSVPAPAVEEPLALFDMKPIVLAGFRLWAQGVDPIDKPKRDEWLGAVEFSLAAEEAAPYWVGDLFLYADTRPEWAEWVAQALSNMKLARQTIHNYKSICRKVAPPNRMIAQSKSHAAEVAPLPPEQQKKWLEKSRDEQWTTVELRRKLKGVKPSSTVLEGQADTLHVVDVTVQMTIEASTPHQAEQLAWDGIKHALEAPYRGKAKVIAAHARD